MSYRKMAILTAGRASIAVLAAVFMASPAVAATTVEVRWTASMEHSYPPDQDPPLIGMGTVSGYLGSFPVTSDGDFAIDILNTTLQTMATGFTTFPNGSWDLQFYGAAFGPTNPFSVDFGDMNEVIIDVPVDIINGTYAGDFSTSRPGGEGAAFFLSRRIGQMNPGCTSVDASYYCQIWLVDFFGGTDVVFVNYVGPPGATLVAQSGGLVVFDFTVRYCGDGLVAEDEQCDDGNDLTGDGCRSDCTAEICGDEILDPQEACDDGNVTSGDGCQANCALPVCGDGITDPGAGEQCDDGNLVGADGCSETCHIEVCGNGTVDPAEECDDANGATGDGCRPDCTQESCGDGVLDPQEQCDDANNAPGDGCRADCTTEICGDGTLDPQEQCDDGNNTSGDGCQAGCALPSCGDFVVDAGEQCDDGNASAGDGCSASCQDEVCGNNILDPSEDCDDGNLTAGDGCRGDCTIEICGDGTLDPQEQCDDGNNVSGDGCSGACQIEATEGGQGCTAGYWSQQQHFDSWTAPYAPETLFDDVFENAFPNQSLVQVLRRTRGGLDALGRQTVAALLNGASSGVSYDLSAPDVIQMFDQTFPGTKDAYNMLKVNFESLNLQVCPLN